MKKLKVGKYFDHVDGNSRVPIALPCIKQVTLFSLLLSSNSIICPFAAGNLKYTHLSDNCPHKLSVAKYGVKSRDVKDPYMD